MIDLHSHILPGIDDGAVDFETALQMVNIAAEDGISHIFTTPHFIQGEIDNNCSRVNNILKDFNEQLEEFNKLGTLENKLEPNNARIMLYPGSEIFISPDIPSLLDEGTICTLNNSSYLLMELPMVGEASYTREIIYQIRLKGYTPIIAHPERYKYVASDPNLVYEYIQAGALIQVNSSSLRGLYGSSIKELSLKLLHHNMVHFVASDAHTCRGRAPKLSKARELVRGEMGDDIAQCLFSGNGRKVISNEPVQIETPKKIVKTRNFFIPLIKKVWPGISH